MIIPTVLRNRVELNVDSNSSYFNHNAEGYHAVMMLFSDRSTPVSYRYADIFSINTYKFTTPVSIQQ